MTTRPLTIADLTTLQTVAEVAQHNSRVTWLNDPDDPDIRQGTARSIGDDRGNFLRSGEDVRDGFLRITSLTGFDYFLPVTHVMALIRDGAFAVDRD